MEIKSFGKSERGLDHLENEDSFLVDDELRLYAVADGVTLPFGGREASTRAVDYLKKFFKGNLKDAVEKANDKILEDKLENNNIGSTTLTAVNINKSLNLAHVGDSSAFLVRDEKIVLLVERHSLGSMLTKVFGQENLDFSYREIKLKKNDYVILATDGITEVLDENDILAVVKRQKEPEKICEKIIEAAKIAYSTYNDDKTVVVINYE